MSKKYQSFSWKGTETGKSTNEGGKSNILGCWLLSRSLQKGITNEYVKRKFQKRKSLAILFTTLGENIRPCKESGISKN